MLCKGEDLENVLYALDFSKGEMKSVSKNRNAQKLITVVAFKDQLVSLQGNGSLEGMLIAFLEVRNQDGRTKQVDLKKSDDLSGGSKNQDTSRQILSLDSDDQYLFSIERTQSHSETAYYLCKYDSNFLLAEQEDITNIFTQHGLSANIGSFYAIGPYVCMTDYSNHTIVFQVNGTALEILLDDIDVEWVETPGDTLPYEFFTREAQTIYTS